MATDDNEPQPPPLPHEREAASEPEPLPEAAPKRKLGGRGKKKSAAQIAMEAEERRQQVASKTIEKAKEVSPTFEVLTPGEKFGEFQILKCLSFDIIGTLYRVRKAKDREEHCLVVMPKHFSSSDTVLQRLPQVFKKLRTLDNPDILSPQEQTKIKDHIVFVTKGTQASNLADFFENEAKESKDGALFSLPHDVVKRIVMKVLQALSYAADHGLNHYNLTPSNILRTANGEILVSGFGLADLIGQSDFEAAAASSLPPIAFGPSHSRINTPDIITPEARKGDSLDARADLYAVGILAYWLLTGRKAHKDYQPASQLVPSLSVGWDVIIERCLEPNRKDRYGSAKAVLEDLEEVDTLKPGVKRKPKSLAAGGGGMNFNRLLGFIPVPKSLEDKNAGLATGIRLGVVGLLVVVLALLALLVPGMLGADSEASPVKLAMAKTADLTLNVSPANATVTHVDQNESFQPTDGVVQLRAPDGTHRFRIAADGYVSETVTLDPATSATRTVTLKAEPVRIVITTAPEALVAAIPAKGGEPIAVGMADVAGNLVSEQLSVGTYTLVVDRDNFQRQAFPDTAITEAGQQLDLPIEPLPSAVRVEAEGSRADVIINGERVGETALELTDYGPGQTLDVTVSRPGYLKKQTTVTTEPNLTQVLDFGELELATFTLVPEITVDGRAPTLSMLSDLSITVTSDNASEPTTLQLRPISGQATYAPVADIPAGGITVSVQHPQFDNLFNEFEVAHGSQVKLEANLARKPTVLQLAVSPANVPLMLVVNGTNMPLQNRREFSLPSQRDYALTLVAPGYLSVSREIFATPGETIDWEINLEPIPGAEMGQDYIMRPINLALQWIGPGTFEMGSPLREETRLPTENELTIVRMSYGYWIGQYEVTQLQYRAIMNDNPSTYSGGNRPVERVSWEGAMTFCERLTEIETAAGRLPEGYVYRLPTEAEWEQATRAGSEKPFHWGVRAGPEDGNFQGIYPRRFSDAVIIRQDHGTKPVGSYPANAFGLFDVHGNVAEWCLDYYNSRLPGKIVDDWVQTDRSTNRRAVRGGGWQDFAKHARSAYRDVGYTPQTRNDNIGFRVVIGPEIPGMREN